MKRSKQHPIGEIDRLFPEEGYGFIDAKEGYHVYFHHNAVRDADFGDLSVGDAVRFIEKEGDEGPQASVVIKVDTAMPQNIPQRS